MVPHATGSIQLRWRRFCELRPPAEKYGMVSALASVRHVVRNRVTPVVRSLRVT
jgi:hypothetical protein